MINDTTKPREVPAKQTSVQETINTGQNPSARGEHKFIDYKGNTSRTTDLMQQGTHICKDSKGNTITAEVNNSGGCTSMQLETPDGKIYKVTREDISNNQFQAAGRLNTYLTGMKFAMAGENVDLSKIAEFIKEDGKEIKGKILDNKPRSQAPLNTPKPREVDYVAYMRTPQGRAR